MKTKLILKIMGKIFHITDSDDRGYDERTHFRGEDDHMLEKAFKEGCEHGYKKAMRELEGYDERRGRTNYKEGFEEKIERLKKKYE